MKRDKMMSKNIKLVLESIMIKYLHWTLNKYMYKLLLNGKNHRDFINYGSTRVE